MAFAAPPDRCARPHPPAGDRVAPRGTLLLEIGIGQAPAIEDLAPAGAPVFVERDLAGIERVVRVQLP